MLLEQLHLDEVCCYSCLLYGTVSHDLILQHRNETIEQGLLDFTRRTYFRLHQTQCLITVPDKVDLHLMCYWRDVDVARSMS